MKQTYTNVNTNKLHDELINAGIVPLLVESNDTTTWVTYAENTDMSIVQAVLDAHDPTPIPPQPTEQERIDALERALLEVIMNG